MRTAQVVETSTVVGIVLASAAYLVVGLWVAYVGVAPIWRAVDRGFKRVVYGPEKTKELVLDCAVQHQIAKVEVEIYGEIVSESVEEHLRNCKVPILRSSTYGTLLTSDRKKEHKLRAACDHRWEVERDLSGVSFKICTNCGEMRR